MKTLYRWQAEGILCGQNLEDPGTGSTVAQPKHRRAELFGEGKKRGMSVDNLKQLFGGRRSLMAGQYSEAIEAYIKRYGKEAKTTVASADAMSLEVQIVAWKNVSLKLHWG